MAELSGFEVLALLKEIEGALRGTYVNNIYRFGASQLFRFRKPDSEDVWLVVSPKKGMWVSRAVTERAETTEFTTRLRRELERARFLGASQVDLDRVFELELEGAEPRKLVLELMPPGNTVVTDGQGKVIIAEQEVRTPARRVVRGAAYAPPAQSRVSPMGVDAGAVSSMAAQEKTVGSAIGRHIALPRKYVSECLRRLKLEDDSPSSELAGRQQEVAETLRGMIEEARNNPRPCICETSRGDEVFVFPPSGVQVKESAGSLSELCDKLFLQEVQTERAGEPPEAARRKEIQVTVSRLRSESASLLAGAAIARDAAAKARSSGPEGALRILRESGVKPAREPSSPDAVASLLYDQAKRLEAKSAVVVESAERLEKKMPKAAPGPAHTRPLPRRRQEWYERFRWFFTSEGRLAVGGRDAQTNSTLIARHLEIGDRVYHADLFGSPFFILKGGEGQGDEEVAQVAQATVAFSSAWKTGLGSADAYWVAPDQVRTAAPSGEYLQRGSFAIVGRKNYVTKVIVEIAAGIDEGGRLLVGPEAALRQHLPRYLVLRPQKEKGSDTAKRVLKDLSAPMPEGTPGVSLDEVLRMLPTGGGKVVRRAGGSPAGA